MANASRKTQQGRRDVLREIHTGGPRTYAEITSALKRIDKRYSLDIVKRRVAELRDIGHVRIGDAAAVGLQAPPPRRSSGRPRHFVTLADCWGLGVGVDIGRAEIRCAVVSPSGDMHQRCRRRRSSERLEPTFRTAAALVNEVLAALEPAQRRSVVGVALAVPAPVDRQTCTVAPEILAGWGMEALDRRFSDMLAPTELPVTLFNDANARAIGEGRFGVARAAHSAFVLKVSGGVGGALLRRGRVLRGSRGLSGEIGHMGVRLEVLVVPLEMIDRKRRPSIAAMLRPRSSQYPGIASDLRPCLAPPPATLSMPNIPRGTTRQAAEESQAAVARSRRNLLLP